MSIQAIETRWRGYRFRSRLEARWGVFFESAGYRWQYEPEGYWVSDTPYLPDFLLPDHALFFDIKPLAFAELPEDDAEAVKMASIMSIWNAEISDREHLYVLAGEPYPDRHIIMGIEGPFDMHIAPCRRCKGVSFVGEASSSWGEIGKHECGDHEREPLQSLYAAAFNAAMGARFEHGEQP